jgi:hypothetical protein
MPIHVTVVSPTGTLISWAVPPSGDTTTSLRETQPPVAVGIVTSCTYSG